MSIPDKIIKKIVNAIQERGYIISTDIIPPQTLNKLMSRVQSFACADLKLADIGRGENKQHKSNIRQDRIKWLEAKDKTDNEFLQIMELLRQGLNKHLYLGLFDYESHYAIYTEGAFYKKHIDALKGKSNRVLSTVLYLNKGWNTDNKGELVLYDTDGETILDKISPTQGTIVIFLSEKFPHEVLRANKERYSIAGWFRLNSSSSSNIDTIR